MTAEPGRLEAERYSSRGEAQFHLHPLSLSDFVLHNHNADYHVHSLVLATHSAYFRAYLDTLQPLTEVQVEEVGDDGRKKCRVTAFTSRELCSTCEPSSLTRCIDLSDQCGIMVM